MSANNAVRLMVRILTRLKLVKELDQALAHGHVLIEAPAGFGKTLLLQQLVQYRPDSHLIQLDPTDLDLAVLRARVEPAVQAGHTVLLDDVHQVGAGTAAAAWLQERLEAEQARFVVAGGCRSIRPGWPAPTTCPAGKAIDWPSTWKKGLRSCPAPAGAN